MENSCFPPWTQTCLSSQWYSIILTRSAFHIASCRILLIYIYLLRSGPQVCIESSIPLFEWYLFELVSRSPSELGTPWSSFSSSLWVILFLVICCKISWHANTVLYNFTFPNDHAYLKCLVYGIYILEFMQSVLIIEAGFRTFVTGFGDVPAAFNRVKTEWLSVPILTAIGKLCCVE